MSGVLGRRTMEVKLRKTNLVIGIGLGFFIFALGVAVFITNGLDRQGLIIGAVTIVLAASLPLLILLGYRKSITFFTEDGVTRYDGKKFLWTDLKGVNTTIVRNRNLATTEFKFNSGKAVVVSSLVTNYDEVWGFIQGLNRQISG